MKPEYDPDADVARLPEPSNPVTPKTPVGKPHPTTQGLPFDPENPLELTLGSEWLVDLEWAEVEGRLECVGFRLHHATLGRSVTASLLRSLPIASFIQAERRQKASEAETFLMLSDETGYSGGLNQYMRHMLKAAHAKRPRYPEDHYELVARVYDAAFQTGLAPTKAVQEHFAEIYDHPVSRSAAAKWVMTCRKMGLLPATQPRTATGNPNPEGEEQ